MDIVLECNSLVSLLILELFKYHSRLHARPFLPVDNVSVFILMYITDH